VHKLIYLDILLDILICLKPTTVSIYNCIYIYLHLLPRTKDTYIKMLYNIIGFLIICFKRNRCRNFIISFKKNKKIGKYINYNYFSDIY